MIQAEKISKKYKQKTALSEVSFQVQENEIVGLVGPNGAGKSTLLRILTGVSHPSSGQVTKKENLRMGAVFDYNGLYSRFTGYENMRFFYRLNPDNPREREGERIEEILERMGLSGDAHRQVRGYSKGMARKLAISRALLTSPDVLVLDEPFDGLDISSHAFLMQFLKEWAKEKGRTVIFSSHNMADVEDLCDRVLMIKKGMLQNNLSMYDLKNQVAEQYRILLEKEGEPILVKGGLEEMNRLLHEFLDQGLRVREVGPVFRRMEDVYLMEMGEEE